MSGFFSCKRAKEFSWLSFHNEFFFSALRQENKDMKSYIDRLLPKVIMNCPEALEAERYLNKTG